MVILIYNKNNREFLLHLKLSHLKNNQKNIVVFVVKIINVHLLQIINKLIFMKIQSQSWHHLSGLWTCFYLIPEFPFMLIFLFLLS